MVRFAVMKVSAIKAQKRAEAFAYRYRMYAFAYATLRCFGASGLWRFTRRRWRWLAEHSRDGHAGPARSAIKWFYRALF